MKNLVSAVLKVMADCESLEKNTTVGSGRYAYKGVSDKDVKLMFNRSMRNNGLVIFPIDVNPKTTVTSWESEDNYGKTTMKFSYFTEVITKYQLVHESGESIVLAGLGHGVDASDKGAGKATTYALKYNLLYSFLVATGTIDDADNTHSNDVPNVGATKTNSKTISDDRFEKAISLISSGKVSKDSLKEFSLTKEQQSRLNEIKK